MTYNPDRHHRRSTRLPTFDYAGDAAYFVTLCTLNRAPVFGSIVDGEMHLSPAGELVTCAWFDSPAIRSDLSLDAVILMPNHLHGIVSFAPEQVHVETGRTAVRPYEDNHPVPPDTMRGEPSLVRRPRSLGSFIAQFKATSTRAINLLHGAQGTPVWQRGFHEHVVRDDRDLDRIRAYIAANPSRWPDDPENQP